MSFVSISDTDSVLVMVLGCVNKMRQVKGVICMVVNDPDEST